MESSFYSYWIDNKFSYVLLSFRDQITIKMTYQLTKKSICFTINKKLRWFGTPKDSLVTKLYHYFVAKGFFNLKKSLCFYKRKAKQTDDSNQPKNTYKKEQPSPTSNNPNKQTNTNLKQINEISKCHVWFVLLYNNHIQMVWTHWQILTDY